MFMPEIKSSDMPGSFLGYSKVKQFLGRPESPAFIFLLVLLLVFSMTTSGFGTVNNLVAIVEQAVIISIVGLAVNQVILTAEIDVSVGSILVVCAFTFGNLSLLYGGYVVPLFGSVVVGALIGSINGALTAYGRVPSIIATLGTLFIFRGLILTVAGAQVINVPAESRVLGLGELAEIPLSVLLLFVLVLVMRWISRNTSWGINVYAVGGNERGAKTLGLPARSTRFWAFVLSGVFCGLGAAVFLGQIGQLQATAATAFELKVITAVVIGGTSIRGGRGSIYSPIIGALLVGVILNAMTLNRVPGTMELLVLGTLILLSITFDGFRQRYLEQGS
jgi:ribose/xylose/arabinose/galactoside ABC-type transport system permease subunit